MPNLLIRDLPVELHNWLREQASANHRSANRQAIAFLEGLRLAPSTVAPAQAPLTDAKKLAALRAKVVKVQRKIAALPTLKTVPSDDAILGYDEHGLPA